MTATPIKTIEDLQTEYQGILSDIVNADKQETLLFNYFGDFNQAKVDSILQMVETSIIEAGDKRQTMKRVCAVLIEMAQNISIHGAHASNGRMHAYCMVVRGEEYYRLLTGNLVLALELPVLNQKLKELHQMDKNTIRKMFIETLCNDDFNVKGGAGLGLLTIAKRANTPIGFELSHVSSQLGYYQLDVHIPKV